LTEGEAKLEKDMRLEPMASPFLVPSSEESPLDSVVELVGVAFEATTVG